MHARRIVGSLTLLALLAVSPSCDDASPGVDPRAAGVVLLRSGDVPVGVALTDADRRALVQLAGTADGPRGRAAARTAGRAVGGVIEAPVGPDTYLVSLPAGAGPELTLLLADAGARVGPYAGAHKVAPELARLDERTETGTARVPVVVHLFADADPAAVAEALRARGYPVQGDGRGPRFGRVTLLEDQARVAATARAIAARDDVMWVDRRPARRLLNGTTAWVGQSGLDGDEATPLYDHGLNGEGQIAGLFDTGVDIDHCFFRDEGGLPPVNGIGGTEVDLSRRKVIAVNMLWEQDDPNNPQDWDDHGHGTHVGGTIAGDAQPYGAHAGHDGMAPAAKLVFQDGGFATDDCADTPALGCPVTDIHFLFEQAYAQGVRVHNNSWGDNENAPIKSVYTDGSQDADEFMWANPDFLLVFAVGNNGPALDTICGPATSKNSLGVGATRRAYESVQLAGFSSVGPTDDGRIKPDVTFPGVQIRSSTSDGHIQTDNCDLGASSGTSMAAPGAAGMAVLARQYYMDGFYPGGAPNEEDSFVPSAALLKATLINSTRAMAALMTPPPSRWQGWGRLTLDDTLHFTDDPGALYVDDDAYGIEQFIGPPVEYEVEVHSDSQPLRATLAWTDYPSVPMATTHLVNDLDLVLTGPGGEYLGNALLDGESQDGGEPDRANNVEQIIIAAPPPGQYTLEVRPHVIAEGPQQPFALVLRGDLDAQRITPQGGETTDGTGSSSGSDSGGTESSTTSDATGPDTDPTTAGPTTTSDPGTGSDATGDTQTGTTADSETTATGEEGDGCSCRTGFGDTTPTPLLLLLLIATRRRRLAPVPAR